MSGNGRLRIKCKGIETARLTRDCLRDKRLVYVILADRKLAYPDGKSPIAYIGMTRKGVSRVLSSLAFRAKTILRLRGVRACYVKLVTCTPRDGLETWRILERALLAGFRHTYGDTPRCNTQGKKLKLRKSLKHFRPERIAKILKVLEKPVPNRGA